ncbi:dockerin type I domain-containing protein [Allorhodopirellula solitaria]|uniref:dockerin type I domain-containing protein n=1 Tax=Allorhodopirellula solitaria TaxID=2527987 RepID=UPI00164419BC|nr:dockerin type I domain-containing protein [Allorhodopirellula solitaria]
MNDKVLGDLSTDSRELNGEITTVIDFSAISEPDTPDSFSLAVAYDPAVVRLVEVTIGDAYETLSEHREVPSVPGAELAAIELNGSSVYGQGDGKIGELQWERIAEGDPAIRLEPSISWRLQSDAGEITPQVVATAARFKRSADVDGNGEITALDALQVINSLAESSSSTTSGLKVVADLSGHHLANDVNSDGKVTALDALMIINILGQDTTAHRATFPVLPSGSVDRLFANQGDPDDEQRLDRLF